MEFRIIEETEKSGKNYFYIQVKIISLFWVYIRNDFYPVFLFPFKISWIKFESFKDAANHIEQIGLKLQNNDEKKIIKTRIFPYSFDTKKEPSTFKIIDVITIHSLLLQKCIIVNTGLDEYPIHTFIVDEVWQFFNDVKKEGWILINSKGEKEYKPLKIENNPVDDVLYQQKDGDLASLVGALEENKKKSENLSISSVFEIQNDLDGLFSSDIIVDIADIENEPDYRCVVVERDKEKKCIGQLFYKVHINDISKYDIVKFGRIMRYNSDNKIAYIKPLPKSDTIINNEPVHTIKNIEGELSCPETIVEICDTEYADRKYVYVSMATPPEKIVDYRYVISVDDINEFNVVKGGEILRYSYGRIGYKPPVANPEVINEDPKNEQFANLKLLHDIFATNGEFETPFEMKSKGRYDFNKLASEIDKAGLSIIKKIK